MAASLLGIPHVVIQFNLYEHLKKHGVQKYNRSPDNLPLHYIFMISVFSKSIINCLYTFIYSVR